MKYPLSAEISSYLERHQQDYLDLAMELGKIPAPLNGEKQRADFCQKYLHDHGLTQAYIDGVENVICPIAAEDKTNLIVFAGHLDVVFPDTTELPMRVEDGRIYCPGIVDDTVNAAAVMMMVRMVHELKLAPDCNTGLLFVMNSGEEGLGNLKGTRNLFAAYGDRIREFYTFDGFYDSINNDAVGSIRYELEFSTEGGHSYVAFGNKSAIHFMANFITTLCQVPVPKKKKTTYNVGMISGGTSVNTIAQQAKMTYEFRSCGRECLAFMDNAFKTAVEAYRAMGVQIDVTLLGERLCSADVDVSEITQFTKDVVEQYGITPDIRPGSTDANIPLSLGVPAVCTAVCMGYGMHTREEWVDIQSMEIGMKIAATIVNKYAK